MGADPQILPVDPQYWDQTMDVLNILYDLHYELGMIANWQGEEGHHADPITDEYEGNDICGVLMQHLVDVRKPGVSLQVVRGRAGRLLAPASRELAQQLGVLAGPVRRLVTVHLTRASPYKLVIEEPLLQQLRSFQE